MLTPIQIDLLISLFWSPEGLRCPVQSPGSDSTPLNTFLMNWNWRLLTSPNIWF